MPISQC